MKNCPSTKTGINIYLSQIYTRVNQWCQIVIFKWTIALRYWKCVCVYLWYCAWRNWNSSLMRSHESDVVNFSCCDEAWNESNLRRSITLFRKRVSQHQLGIQGTDQSCAFNAKNRKIHPKQMGLSKHREICNQEWIQVYWIKKAAKEISKAYCSATFKTHNLEGVCHVWSATSPEVFELHVFCLQVSLFP